MLNMIKLTKHLWFFTCFMLLLSLSACHSSSGYQKISLSPAEEVPAVYSEEALLSHNDEISSLNLAIAPVVSPQRGRDSYGELAQYLEDRLGYTVNLVQRPTYIEINQLLRQGHVDVAFICTLPYVQGQEDFGLELLVVPRIRGKTTYSGNLIVAADSGINSLEELRGESFAFSDPLSFTGYLYMLHHLYQNGETPDSFFSEHIFTYSHDYAVRAVADGLVIGATAAGIIYDSMLEENPALGDEVRIIQEYHPVGNPPVVVRPGIPADLRQNLEDILLSMHHEESGLQALADMGVERFMPPNDRDYDFVRQLVQALKED